MCFKIIQQKYEVLLKDSLGEAHMSLSPYLKICSAAIGCCLLKNHSNEFHMPTHSPIFLPSISLSLRFSLCTAVYHMRHLIYFRIQKRGSRKGSIDIRNIRCVEKVNLEEQTPVERQYPFQVRGGAMFSWREASLFIFSTMNSRQQG